MGEACLQPRFQPGQDLRLPSAFDVVRSGGMILPAPAATLPPSPAANGGTDPLPADGLPSAQATVVALAAADLAERTGAAETEIELVLIAADDLPAGDLGCRSKGTPAGVQPGFVTGWVIRLRAAGAEYEYHAHGGQVAYCGAIAAL